MRNKYTKEFETFVKENISKYKKEEFRLLLENKFNMQITTDALRRYLNRKHIKARYIDYVKHNVRKNTTYKRPVGAEQITKDGVFIKVAQPDKWRRKSRVMYEKYHNCELKENEYIIFLNKNNNDFSKENLMKTSLKEMAYLRNKEMYSSNPKITELGLLTAKLMIKVKEKGVNLYE